MDPITPFPSQSNVAIKLRDYKLLLSGQLLMLVHFLVISEIITRYPFAYHIEIFVAVTFFLSCAMNYIGYQLLKVFTHEKQILNWVFGLITIGMLTAIYIGSPWGPINDQPIYKTLNVISSLSLLISFVVILYYMVHDIFNEHHNIIYRLWGAASIYLLLGILFGNLYFVLEILFPAEFGANASADIRHFIKCYNMSFYVMSGIDQPFEEMSRMVRNVTVVESIFSNLYIVLLVGRLLSK